MKTKKLLEGKVVSDKMNKTVIAITYKKIKHKKYHKFIKKSTKYFVHDDKNECKIDDIIFFKEVAPISKKKCFLFVGKK
jgi:small subunit ribosomal protein S17